MATIEISEKAEGSFSWPCFGIILPFYNKDHEMNNIPNHLLSFIDYLVAKRDMFMRDMKTLSTVVVGSSHGDFGFNPKFCSESFNLCSRSQDFKYSYFLYNRAIINSPNLKNIVVFYSLFSSGNILESSPGEKFLAPLLNEIFELSISYCDPDLVMLSESLHGRLRDLTSDLDGLSGFMPNHEKVFMPADYGVERRVREHMTLNAKEEGNEYLARILLLAAELGHNVVMVIPPVHQQYKAEAGGDTHYLFRGLFELIELMKILCPTANIQVVNGYDDYDFMPHHFGDFDHLIPEGDGAMILSQKISNAVQQS